MVCPGIIVGECAIGLHKTSGHIRAFCDQRLLRIRAAVRKSRARLYSAASLAPLAFRGLPSAFFSTGARNLPV
jgi:hypothetical protein